MRAGYSQRQTGVLVLGFTVSVGVGALLGFGQYGVLAVAAVLGGVGAVTTIGLRRYHPSAALAGYWSLAGAFFALPLNSVRISSSITLGDVLIVISAGCVAYLLLSGQAVVPRPPVWMLAGVAAIVFSLLLVELAGDRPGQAFSAILVQFQGVGFEEPSNLASGVRLIIAMTLLPFLAAILVRSWGDLRLLSTAWIAGVTASSLIVVFDSALGTDLAGQVLGAFAAGTTGDYPGRATGLAVHPTTLGLTIAMALPVALFRIRDARSCAIYLPIVLAMVVAMALSGSRGGFVGIAAALLVGVFFLSRRQGAIALASLLVIGSALLLGAQLGVPGVERFAVDSPYTVLSDETRRSVYESSIRLVSDSPVIGYGFDTVRVSHNIALQLLIAGGVLALVGYLSIVLGYLASGIRLLRELPERSRVECGPLCLSLVVYLVAGLFYSQIYDRYIFIPAALIFAVTVGTNLRTSGLPER